MRKCIYLIFAILFGLSSCKKADIGETSSCTYNNAADTSSRHPKAAKWQAIMDKYIKQRLPGMSVLIEDENGEWISSGGYADIEKEVKFIPCTPSKAASITKLMVATLIYKLQEQGKLHIDDPLSKYISKDILDKIPNASKSTIRNVMQHTSGIYDITTDSDFYLAVLNNPNKSWQPEEVLKYAYGKDPYNEVGDTSYYSNTNTVFVIMCAEKVLGYSHVKALREMIWDPLGMHDTYIQSRDVLPKEVAQGYYDLYNNGTLVNVSNIITGSGNGYGGLFTTILDLKKFIKALYYDKTLINAESLAMLGDFMNEDENNRLSPGAMLKFRSFTEHEGLGHSGRDLGYSADLFMFPTRNNRLLIFLVNYGTNAASDLREVFRAFEKELVLDIVE